MPKRILILATIVASVLLVGSLIKLDSAIIADDCSDLSKQKNFSWLRGQSDDYNRLKELRQPIQTSEPSLADFCGIYDINLRLL